MFSPGNLVGSKPSNQSSLTILGLHLTGLPFKKMSFFTNKKEVQKSATALGYVAHVCSFSLLERLTDNLHGYRQYSMAFFYSLSLHKTLYKKV